MRKESLQKGQALIIVLLSLAVVLTIVLFILARSTTDIAVSSRSEEAARAFSAAEAGIENSLVIGTGGSNTNLGNNAGYLATVSGYAENSTDYNYPVPMNSGDSMTTWFVSHDESGNLVCDASHPCFTGTVMYVCWGDPAKISTPGTDPAIEVSIFYETIPNDISTLKIARFTADPNPGRVPPNNFEAIGLGAGCPNGANYAHSKLYTFANRGIPSPPPAPPLQPGQLLYARIRMFYNTDTTQPLGITVMGSGSLLPSQGQDIVSTGTAGQSNRKVEVFQGWPEPPEVFDFAIYAPQGLTR